MNFPEAQHQSITAHTVGGEKGGRPTIYKTKWSLHKTEKVSVTNKLEDQREEQLTSFEGQRDGRESQGVDGRLEGQEGGCGNRTNAEGVLIRDEGRAPSGSRVSESRRASVQKDSGRGQDKRARRERSVGLRTGPTQRRGETAPGRLAGEVTAEGRKSV